MQTKAYFASSVPAALEVARQELGDNALLVSSRPTAPQARQYGRFEVTFAWDPKEMPRPQMERQSESQPPQTRNVQARNAQTRNAESLPARRHIGATLPPASAVASPGGSEMDEIRQQLSALRVAVSSGRPLPAAPVADVAADRVADRVMVERLLDAGFSRETAQELTASAARRPGNPDTAVVHELASRIPVVPFVEMKPGESRTLAFIGPPGRGKTTSLVKIAINMGLSRRVPVRIYCAGAHSIGAQEQLARFAAILGTPYQACESLASLNLALNGEGWKGLALIDTPGISPADRNELGELRSFFSARPEIEKHLVLRADASSADMLHMTTRFSGLTPSRLLFTGMDEATRVAPAVEALIRSGVPATFACTGPQLPEDLEELTADRLAAAVWAGWAGAASLTKDKFMQAAA